jgi:chromosome segregation ATPase
MNYFKRGIHLEEGIRAKYKKIFLFAGVAIVAILLLIFVIRPSITGYGVYKDIKNSNLTVESFESQVSNLKRNLEIASTNLTSCQSFYTEILGKYEQSNNKQVDCQGKLSALQTQVNTKNSNEQSELTDLQEDYDELIENYDSLAEDAANKICCIKKQLENSDINSYSIDEDRIVCSTDADNSISC